MRLIDRRIVNVGQHQGKLYTSVPIRWRFIFPRMFQVKRYIFNLVSVRVEEDAPIPTSDLVLAN